MSFKRAITMLLNVILLVVTVSATTPLPPFLQPIARQSYPEYSQSKSCTFCRENCGTVDKVSRWISDCHNVRAHLREIVKRDDLVDSRKRFGYPDALLFYCWKQYCKTFKPVEYCGLRPPGKVVTTEGLNAQIATLQRERVALTARWRREAVPKFAKSDYLSRRAEVVRLQNSARKFLSIASAARKKNWELKKKITSLQYRKQLFNKDKMASETVYFKETRFYWTRLNVSLSRAVRTSSLAIQEVRTTMEQRYEKLNAEVKRSRRLKANVDDREKTMEILDRQVVALQRNIERIKQDVIITDEDFTLFVKVGMLITNMLRSMSSLIRSGNIEVECGNDALATAIARFTTRL